MRGARRCAPDSTSTRGAWPTRPSGLDRALSAAVAELTAERRQDLAIRIAELDQLRSGVATQAQSVLEGGERRSTRT